MDKLLSIIIPIFKVEEYLRECVDSVLCQCNNQCEIILVDDGSPDSCPQICDKYELEYEIIRTIHKENGGSSSARNAGLEAATGKYVTFLDADDKLANNSIPNILEWIKSHSVDICFMNAVKFYKDGRVEDMNDSISADGLRGKEKEICIKYLTSRPKFSGSACTKIYCREYLEKFSIRFPKDRRLSEDLGFVRDAILYADSYDSLGFDYYQYRQGRDGSNSSSFTDRHIDGLHLFIEESVSLLCKETKPINNINKYMMSFVAYEYAVLLFGLVNSNQKDSEFITKYRWVLKYGNEIKLKVINYLSVIIGIKNTAKIIRHIKKQRISETNRKDARIGRSI